MEKLTLTEQVGMEGAVFLKIVCQLTRFVKFSYPF